MDSITARVSCFARAYHRAGNDVCEFDDPAAAKLLGTDYERVAESMKAGLHFFLPGFTGTPEEGLRLIVDRQLSPSVLARSTYCEKVLANEILWAAGSI